MNSEGTKKDFTCQLAWKLTLCVLSVSRLLRLLKVLHKYHFLLEL